MTVTFVDRTDVQNAFSTLVNASLVGSGKPLQAFYGYQIAEPGKKLAVGIITASGSNRRNPFHSLRDQSQIFLDVHILVLYADTTNGWTEAQSEARLNLIEKGIDEIVANNPETSTWMSVDFAGQSEIQPTTIGGVDYRYEVIPLVFEVRA